MWLGAGWEKLDWMRRQEKKSKIIYVIPFATYPYPYPYPSATNQQSLAIREWHVRLSWLWLEAEACLHHTLATPLSFGSLCW